MRLAPALILLSGCGRPEGALLEIHAENIPAGPAPACVTTDIRVLVESGPDRTVREASWDGADPFVFQVLVPALGDAQVTVSAAQYLTATDSVELARTGPVLAPLVDGAAALTIEASFPDCAE